MAHPKNIFVGPRKGLRWHAKPLISVTFMRFCAKLGFSQEADRQEQGTHGSL